MEIIKKEVDKNECKVLGCFKQRRISSPYCQGHVVASARGFVRDNLPLGAKDKYVMATNLVCHLRDKLEAGSATEDEVKETLFKDLMKILVEARDDPHANVWKEHDSLIKDPKAVDRKKKFWARKLEVSRMRKDMANLPVEFQIGEIGINDGLLEIRLMTSLNSEQGGEKGYLDGYGIFIPQEVFAERIQDAYATGKKMLVRFPAVNVKI